MNQIPYRRLLKLIGKEFQRRADRYAYNEHCKKTYGIDFSTPITYNTRLDLDVRAAALFAIGRVAAKLGRHIRFCEVWRYQKDLRNLAFYEEKIESTIVKYTALKRNGAVVQRLPFGPEWTIETVEERVNNTTIFAHASDGSVARRSLSR